ncbi:fimbrial protein [Enterobacter ludwigii]|uniref:fimbrial protein n=1 Tax=Enterobacter ludwigii TaxID=299767 RepID=UPI001E34F079|nr:fimbrial protein [Enterobacter ludwigii]MCE1613491.1 type 1 fimbrial protein [Enterobacter ludwigii]MCE1626792.1 type 1 fimbrial protein [Enterobacter ludwigii]
MTMKTHWQKTVPTLVLLALMMELGSSGARAAGDSVDLTFKYTVLQGTCNVSVGDDGTSGALNFGDISTASLPAKNWDPMTLVQGGQAKLPFIVQLRGCSGVAGTPKPALTLTGKTDAYTANSTNKSFMFVDPGSTAKGVGFAIYKIDGTASTDLVAEITSVEQDSRKYIYLKNAPGGVAPDQDVTLNAIVTCGSTCGAADKAKMKTGDLMAQVTFDFVYH